MDMFVPINEFSKKDWLMHQTRKQWITALRNLDSDSITWKAPWSKLCEPYGLNHMEFDYGGPSYVNQLIELSRVWKEPQGWI